jgi:hypothetical protein
MCVARAGLRLGVILAGGARCRGTTPVAVLLQPAGRRVEVTGNHQASTQGGPGVPGRRPSGPELPRYTYVATAPDGRHVQATTTRQFTHAVVVDKASYTGELASRRHEAGWGLWAFVGTADAAGQAARQAARLYEQVAVVPVDNPRGSDGIR